MDKALEDFLLDCELHPDQFVAVLGRLGYQIIADRHICTARGTREIDTALLQLNVPDAKTADAFLKAQQESLACEVAQAVVDKTMICMTKHPNMRTVLLEAQVSAIVPEAHSVVN